MLAGMRTAVVRVRVDPEGNLDAAQLDRGLRRLRELGAEVVDNDLAGMPAGRREVQLLIAGSDPTELEQAALTMCADAFGTAPIAGVVTYVSRGTDDDAHGVLAGFGLTGDIARKAGTDGFDVVTVTLRAQDLERVPESRIHTALEASLNCEVLIRTN